MAEKVKKATRESYGEALRELAEEYPRVVVLDADLAEATKTALFRDAYPERFIDCGIAECNMVGVAAGLASCGKIPFATSFAMFSAGRAYEQVRNSVGYPRLNVKIVGSHAGVSVGEDGATHQCCEDIALMRTVPGMVVLNPADHYEMKAAVKAAVEWKGPVYIRLGRLAVESFNNSDGYSFELGKGITLRDGKDLTIIATGLMVSRALEAVKNLERQGVDARLINIHTIKPIDRELVVRAARETGKIITVEEHSVIGGLGDAVCGVLSGECPVRVVKIGVNDQYGHSGPAQDLLDEFGLNADHIAETARKVMERS
ncbi:1-deoxy-D-xylulose-5-phosphate synthase [Caprobacter fermentans]|uniref:1-deoxy-D-xylulose-5-phosphate synthase n=1 Tax=Caproicibacter fermentans TaxID=2576756 RepID=A0A6N8HX65_9FIRM|nr:transketolase family protein [Caproicibacter fermentans]MVB10097.1 1-deoxy-D-xylulose-5-phosphate synthase [Caproicibacter fermentans]OCN03364.1 transketolase [Clostridium sp. W14A]QNK40170.1 transketolase family protein [Caproicibacter fermentans]